MNYWERKEILFKYTEGAREFFPMAHEQLDTIARIIEKYTTSITHFMDLGCGAGFLGHFIAQLFTESKGTFLDISKEMIEKARQLDNESRHEFIICDFSKDDWNKQINIKDKFDLIVSGYAIHHISNEKKKRLYSNVYNLLKPGGIFLNLEHVSSPSKNLEEIFQDLFDDGMMEYQKHIGDEKTKEEIKEMYHNPEHKSMNVLESVELQCDWLRDLGFSEVDCYMKIFELALFGGIKKV